MTKIFAAGVVSCVIVGVLWGVAAAVLHVRPDLSFLIGMPLGAAGLLYGVRWGERRFG